MDVPLRCRCGHVRGVAREVSPRDGFRFVCYCDDCQTFARFLGRPDVLDAAGGTDIFQMPPARVQLASGGDALRCVRLSTKTKVLRWYADCCRTPIANSAGPAFPMIAIIHAFMDHAAGGHSRDAVLGPPLCRIFERSATAPLPPGAPPPPSIALFARRAWMLLRWRVRGLHQPTPFFDARTKRPVVEPHLVGRGQRGNGHAEA